MKNKIALITGVTGQDGSYLAEFLLKKKYIVHGIIRRSSSINTSRLNSIYQKPIEGKNNFIIHYGDINDQATLTNLIFKIKPNEVYNLAAQSHVKVSFENPVYTSETNAIGTLKLLEACKAVDKKIKIYQASSSEMYGKNIKVPQDESSFFYPSSPYAVSKVFAYWICVNYRESYNMFISNGILFNHESSRRGLTFVTRKITRGLVRVFLGIDKHLYVGNLYAKRDWGHAKDYVRMQWLMLQQKKPDDYVISTGKSYSVKDFINKVTTYLGIKIKWVGKGLKEHAVVIDIKNISNTSLKKGSTIVKVNKKYLRPSEVPILKGDNSKAKKNLKWKNNITVNEMIKEMVDYDLKIESTNS